MLDLLLSRDDQTFSKLETKLRPVIRRQVATYARSPVLRNVEDIDSLYNIALLKLNEAISNFVYEPAYSQEHNERRFLAMLSKYVKNAMIDLQYAANADKRKPTDSIILSIEGVDNSQRDDSQGDTLSSIEPEDDEPPVDQIAHAREIRELILNSLDEPQDRRVFILLQDGYSAENIAGKLGMLISRVRHTIYEKIQKSAIRYVKP